MLFNRSVQLLHERDDLSLVWRDQSVTIWDLFLAGSSGPINIDRAISPVTKAPQFKEPSNGKESKEADSCSLFERRHQSTEDTLEGENAPQKHCKRDEAHRRFI